jgi:hypothetical protein
MRQTGKDGGVGSVVGVSILAALGAAILLGAGWFAGAADGDASVVAAYGAQGACLGVTAVPKEIVLRMKCLPHQHLLLVSWNGHKTGGHLVLPTLSTTVHLLRMHLLPLSSIALHYQALPMIWILLALPHQLHLLQILLAIVMCLITGAILSLL